MARITVVGGTGYAGSSIVREAARRGHQVTAWSRSAPTEPVDGVRYEQGSLTDDAVRTRAVQDADVVVAALSPRADMVGALPAVYGRLAELSGQAGARFGVVGGFGSLKTPTGERIYTDPSFPAEYVGESKELGTVLDELAATPETVDWLYISPAQVYGSYVPGEATGRYRVGGDTPVVDADGNSAISGADFATAIVDEIETPKYHRAHINIAY